MSGGSGGASGCATGAPSTTEVVSGTCKGYKRPSWQNGVFGSPANKVRNLPDVALFAADAPWGHSYLLCATNQGGCVSNFGGTSFAAPIMAGVQALVNVKTKATKGTGNPNVVYYKLAAKEYNSTTQRADPAIQ